MEAARDDFSEAVREDYLKAIYVLEKHGELR